MLRYRAAKIKVTIDPKVMDVARGFCHYKTSVLYVYRAEGHIYAEDVVEQGVIMCQWLSSACRFGWGCSSIGDILEFV